MKQKCDDEYKCRFAENVLCSHRFAIERCLKCSFYRKSMKEMDEEDKKVMEEIDRIRKYGYPKSFRQFIEGAV